MKLTRKDNSMGIETSYAMGEELYRLYNGEISKGHISRIELRVAMNDYSNMSSGATLIETLCFYDIESTNVTTMGTSKGQLFRTKKEAANAMLKAAGFKCGLDDLND